MRWCKLTFLIENIAGASLLRADVSHGRVGFARVVHFCIMSALQQHLAVWSIVVLLSTACTTDPESLPASSEDELQLAKGLKYQVVLRWGDDVSAELHTGYGAHVAALQMRNDQQWDLWVTHEYIQPYLISGSLPHLARKRTQITQETYYTGITRAVLSKKGNGWLLQRQDGERLTGANQIQFDWPEPIERNQFAFGTVATLGGIISPWGTLVTAEGDYEPFYGGIHETGEYRQTLQWGSFLGHPSEHYGWLMESDAQRLVTRKVVAAGRFPRGGLALDTTQAGIPVVYMTEKRADGGLYKFIGSSRNDLSSGALYVANLEQGRWIPLNHADTLLNSSFELETAMLVGASSAARKVGASRLHFPAGVAQLPDGTGVVVAVTGSDSTQNGYLLTLLENGNDAGSLVFETENLLESGEAPELVFPAQVTCDPKGNLWVSTAIPAGLSQWGNNSLWLGQSVPEGRKWIRMAIAPREAVFDGCAFADEGMFVGVNHPGLSSGASGLTSNWPDGEGQVPKPAVVWISGSWLSRMIN